MLQLLIVICNVSIIQRVPGLTFSNTTVCIIAGIILPAYALCLIAFQVLPTAVRCLKPCKKCVLKKINTESDSQPLSN